MKRIRQQSNQYAKVRNIMHFVNESNLMNAHRLQPKKKATGIDGVTKEKFDEASTGNIAKLVRDMKQLKYKPLPVRRAYIPKSNGKLRGLGIPAYADKLVQSVFANILTEVYEPRFLDCSKGFRPGRRAQDAVREIVRDTTVHKVCYIIEADIKGFFDNVNHDWMLKFLRNDIDDETFIRYIARFLKAGIMEGTELTDSDKGTPQGGLISPVLANVYLHYVLDLWIEKLVKPKCKGEVYYVRYADDFIVMTQFKDEAEAILAALKKRLAKFSLEVAEDKTRIFYFGRFCKHKESFDFLGFTFGLGKTRNGKYRTSVRSSEKKLKAKRAALKAWLRENMHIPTNVFLERIAIKLRGHNNYYGVSGNLKAVEKFFRYARRTTYIALCRRSQKKRLNTSIFDRIWTQYVPKPYIAVNIWL